MASYIHCILFTNFYFRCGHYETYIRHRHTGHNLNTACPQYLANDQQTKGKFSILHDLCESIQERCYVSNTECPWCRPIYPGQRELLGTMRSDAGMDVLPDSVVRERRERFRLREEKEKAERKTERRVKWMRAFAAFCIADAVEHPDLPRWTRFDPSGADCECCLPVDLDCLPGDKCSFCLEALRNPHEEVCRIFCRGGHYFHTACVRKWFGDMGSTCPLCNERRRIVHVPSFDTEAGSVFVVPGGPPPLPTNMAWL